jgi:dolichol-phosphate mannosyltransferase
VPFNVDKQSENLPTSSAVAAELEVSVVLPTLRERESLSTVLAALWSSLMAAGHLRAEILVVDDNSLDGSQELCASLAATGIALRFINRVRPTDGLSGAVLEGFRQAKGRILTCMDADGQHPVTAVPQLIAALDSAAAAGKTRPFALGSRYTLGGTVNGRWTAFRRLNSGFATWLARPFAPGVTDPMSGFFALHRKTFDSAGRLAPTGYKIALELMCKCRVDEVVEVPISFGQRIAGHSKLSLREQTRYLEHLSRLYDFHFPRGSPILKFIIASLLGWLAGCSAFLILPGLITGVFAAALANQLVLLLFYRRYVATQRKFLVIRHPWADFILIALAEISSTLLCAAYIGRNVPTATRWEALAIGLLGGIVVRYILRKELLHDLRGLRVDLRTAEVSATNLQGPA